MSALLVSANGIPVGTIEIENGRWKFGYAAGWNAYALSTNFPIATGTFEDTADAKPVEWFFENLLPEGRLRDLIAFRDRIDPRDTWALLLGLTGRNVEPYERLIDRTRREAFVRLKQQAAEHGADTVVAIHVQTTSMDLPKIMACEVLVYGSAYRSL